MSQLKVFLSGIALCHFDTEISNWRIFVPKIEENHVFRISVLKKETSAPDKVLLSTNVETGSKITLTNDSLPSTGVSEPVLLSDNFDLSEIHGEAIPLVDEIDKYAAFITLKGFPSLRSYISFDSPLRYYNLLKFSNGTFVENKGESGCRDVIFTMIQPEIGSRTSIIVNGEDIIADLPHSPEADYEIILDNDCHRIHHPEDKTDDPDFKYYYNIIDIGSLETQCEFKLEVIEEKCEVAGCGPGRASSVKVGGKLKEYLNS